MSMVFTLAPEPEEEARETGRLLFAGPVTFIKGVVAMSGLPPADRVEVWIEVVPRDRRRRDPSNWMPTQKAMIDGLVDYGLVPDDCPPFVTERMPLLLPPDSKNPRVVLVVDVQRQ